MALAVDREGLARTRRAAARRPPSAFTPQGAPAQGRVAPDSRWLPPGGDMGAARDELDEAAVVNRELTLLHVDRPGASDVAEFLQSAWRGLGIDTTIRSSPPTTTSTSAGR